MAYRDGWLVLVVGICFSFATELREQKGTTRGTAESGSGYDVDTDIDSLELSGEYAPTSLCRRQEIEASARHSGEFVAKCDDDGQFEPKQCHRDECWCVNSHGHEITGTRKQTAAPINCLNIEKSTLRSAAVTANRQTVQIFSTRRTTASTTIVNPKTDDVVIDETKGTKHHKNKIDQMAFENNVDISLANSNSNEIEASMLERKATSSPSKIPIYNRPGLLAGIIGGTTLGLLCIVLFVMFLVYRMRKKDEGSYALDEPKSSPSSGLKKPHDREFFA